MFWCFNYAKPNFKGLTAFQNVSQWGKEKNPDQIIPAVNLCNSIDVMRVTSNIEQFCLFSELLLCRIPKASINDFRELSREGLILPHLHFFWSGHSVCCNDPFWLKALKALE